MRSSAWCTRDTSRRSASVSCTAPLVVSSSLSDTERWGINLSTQGFAVNGSYDLCLYLITGRSIVLNANHQCVHQIFVVQ